MLKICKILMNQENKNLLNNCRRKKLILKKMKKKKKNYRMIQYKQLKKAQRLSQILRLHNLE